MKTLMAPATANPAGLKRSMPTPSRKRSMDTIRLSRAIGCTIGKADLWLVPLMEACDKYQIDTKLRLAAFLAQVAHESGRLSILEENLNYSAQALTSLFSKYFTPAMATAYARHPQIIANRIYGNRMGNGNEESGDGWKYRGRGPIQITGKNNYRRCGEALGIGLIEKPELLINPEYGSLSAAWYWDTVNANSYADIGDFDGVSDLINKGRKTAAKGDAIGYADRLAIYQHALNVL